MARKEIGSIFDRNNRNNMNDNFEYLFEGSRKIKELNNRADSVLNEAKKTNDMNKNVQQQINTLIAESGTSDAEVLQARIDAEGNEHPVLKDRLDESDAQLAQTEKIDGFTLNKFLEMPESYLEIPSAIGNSLTTHPSTIDFYEEFGLAQWNGYRYWMAHTPYPGTENENPSVTASNDNETWILPTNAPNPLVNEPADGYYSDTEIIYISELDVLRIYYRLGGASDGQQILYYVESSDGSNWSTPAISLQSTNQLLSPSIVKENSLWEMWTVESSTDINYRTSSDGISWSEPSIIPHPWENWSAWHIGVKKDSNGKYHMLGSTWPNSTSGEGTQYRPIIYAHCDDGLSWIPNEKPQLIPTGWAGGYLYRPTFIIDESKGLLEGMPYVRVWFSASGDGIAAEWHLGYSEGYLMTGDKNPSATSDNIKRKKIGEYFKVFASNIVAPFAKISRLKTKRIELTSDYSQPLVEWRDGRPSGGNGNYLRQEYIGSSTPSGIRSRQIFYDDNGNNYVITITPYTSTPTIALNKKTNINNIRQIKTDEIINSEGIRLYSAGSTSNFNRISTNSLGETVFSLTARGLDYQWKFRAGSGTLDGGNNAIENVKLIKFGIPMAISSAPNGALFEDADGKLKYKNMAGKVTVIT